MAFNGTILTTKGKNLQAKVQTGVQLAFTKAKIGDGVLGVGQNLEALNDLLNPKMTLNIQGLAVLGDGTSRIRTVITNAELAAGFFVREIGVFATDPDLGEILYCIANAGSECDYLPVPGSVSVEQTMDIITAVGNATNVTAVINETIVLATKADITAHNIDINAHSLAMGFWQAARAYAVGDVIRTRINGSYKYMECTVGGISGANEPAWPAVGQTIVDGAVTWTVRDMRVADAQFDNSAKLATTKFVKDSGLQASALKGIAAAETLTAADCGKIISPYANTNQTITLPLCSACPQGSMLTFICNATSNITLTRQGTDVIVVNANPVGINSLVLSEGDSLILVNSGTKWYAIGGSAQMIAAGSIVSSGTGWTKFADGTMIQRGSGVCVPHSSGGTLFNLPLSFFTADFQASMVITDPGTPVATSTEHTGSVSQFRGRHAGASNLSIKYTAIGRWKA
jgi:hypothetical protein